MIVHQLEANTTGALDNPDPLAMLQALQDQAGDMVMAPTAAAAAEEPTITQEQPEPTLPSAEQLLVQIDMSPPNSGAADQFISSLHFAASGEFEASLEAIMIENEIHSAPECAYVSPPIAAQRTGRGRGQTRSAASRTL